MDRDCVGRSHKRVCTDILCINNGLFGSWTIRPLSDPSVKKNCSSVAFERLDPPHLRRLMKTIESWANMLRERPEAEVISFVRQNPELVNVADTASSEYALEQAIFYEMCDLAKLLLDLGADPNQLNDQGRLALHTAIELFESSPKVSLSLFELLLLRGADAEARGFPDFTALHRACAANAIPIAVMLIEHGASLVAAAEAGVDGGRTPLDVAHTHRHKELASVLRSKGAKSADDLSGA